MAIRIGIIEDDRVLCDGLKLAFELDGCETVSAETLKDGLRLIQNGGLHLIILDCNLPDGSGFELLRMIGKRTEIPVLMLTARSGEIDELQALELGVEDFMRKPFSLAVLKARTRKILRKRETPNVIISGEILADLKEKTVLKNGEKLALSALEFRLLTFLMENSGHILTREQILEQVWDSERNFVDENTLAVAIRRLRLKVEKNPSEPERIQTIHGIGYIWKEQTL